MIHRYVIEMVVFIDIEFISGVNKVHPKYCFLICMYECVESYSFFRVNYTRLLYIHMYIGITA